MHFHRGGQGGMLLPTISGPALLVFLDPSGHGGMLPTRNDHLAHRILNVKCAVVISMHHVYESGERFDLVTRHVCVFATCSDLTRHQYACLQASLFLS